MTCGPIRRFVVTAAAAAAVSLLLIYLDAAARRGRRRMALPASGAHSAHTRREAGFERTMGGGGGGAGGAGGVQAIEPNGQVHQFEHYSALQRSPRAG